MPIPPAPFVNNKYYGNKSNVYKAKIKHKRVMNKAHRLLREAKNSKWF